jgi:hypothetical protein
MFKILKASCILGMFVAATYAATPIPHSAPQSELNAKDPISIVITFKDGRQETYSMAEIARVEYKDVTRPTIGADYFLGKWEVGDGNSGSFFILLEPNGEAARSLGANHGTWAVVAKKSASVGMTAGAMSSARWAMVTRNSHFRSGHSFGRQSSKCDGCPKNRSEEIGAQAVTDSKS